MRSLQSCRGLLLNTVTTLVLFFPYLPDIRFPLRSMHFASYCVLLSALYCKLAGGQDLTITHSRLLSTHCHLWPIAHAELASLALYGIWLAGWLIWWHGGQLACAASRWQQRKPMPDVEGRREGDERPIPPPRCWRSGAGSVLTGCQ